jgi:hypothetical protein
MRERKKKKKEKKKKTEKKSQFTVLRFQLHLQIAEEETHC